MSQGEQGRDVKSDSAGVPSAEQQAVEKSNTSFAQRWVDSQIKAGKIPGPGPEGSYKVNSVTYDPNSPPGDKPGTVKAGENLPRSAAVNVSDIKIYSPGARSIGSAIQTYAHELGHFHPTWDHPTVYQYGEAVGRVFRGGAYSGPTP